LAKISEQDLEEPFELLLRAQLGRELLQPPAMTSDVFNTARGGPAEGQWSRPDLVLACIRRYRSRATPELELYGFELKLESGFDVSAVHQALAHTRYVHYSHVVVHCPADDVWSQRLSELRAHAQNYGVGVIRLKRATPEAGYEIALHSSRFNPAPGSVDRFLEDRLPDAVDWIDQQLG